MRLFKKIIGIILLIHLIPLLLMVAGYLDPKLTVLQGLVIGYIMDVAVGAFVGLILLVTHLLFGDS